MDLNCHLWAFCHLNFDSWAVTSKLSNWSILAKFQLLEGRRQTKVKIIKLQTGASEASVVWHLNALSADQHFAGLTCFSQQQQTAVSALTLCRLSRDLHWINCLLSVNGSVWESILQIYKPLNGILINHATSQHTHSHTHTQPHKHTRTHTHTHTHTVSIEVGLLQSNRHFTIDASFSQHQRDEYHKYE